MSDDDSDDLFGGDSGAESDDTDELIATSKKSQSKSPSTKKRLQKKSTSKKSKSSAAGNDDGGDGGGLDDDSDDDVKGLFDSDEEEEKDDEDDSKPAAKSKAASNPSSSNSGNSGKTLSKRERMEALRAKKRAATVTATDDSSQRRKSKSKSKTSGDPSSNNGNNETGYESEESYNSAEYVRTREDDDFIDTQGEDEEMVREYYAEQHFEDELEDMEVKTKKNNSAARAPSSSKKRGPDQLSAADKKDKDNPISIVVERMKKKKKVTKRFEELKENAIELIEKMEHAAKEDDKSLKLKKPGLKKLQMLPQVLDAMIQREMMRPLLEADFLIIAKKWIQPLDNGSLGNLTLRSQMIDAIAKMNGDFGIDNDDLKKSEFGKLVMTLYMHKKETPEMKRKLKALIEQWSRRIFRKSGDMKQLGSSQAHRRSEAGLVGIAKAQASIEANSEQMRQRNAQSAKRNDNKDIGSILSDGVKQARDLGRNRVRVPYSKGFQFTVRPENKTGDVADKKTRVFNVNDQRESLHKRMLDKNKRTVKNARSANISIEGRPTKWERGDQKRQERQLAYST